MLTEIQINENKSRFIDILKEVNRPGIEDFVNYLDESGFFDAPASTQYNCAFPGGLCLHSLHVYETLMNIVTSLDSECTKFHKDTLIIVSLLHDLYKTNFYELTVSNKKIYSEEGSKSDNLGRFDWVSVQSYKVKDSSEREVFGTKSFNTYMIVSKFLALTEEETVVLANQYSESESNNNIYLSEILAKYPLTVLLHSADTISAYYIESKNEQNN